MTNNNSQNELAFKVALVQEKTHNCNSQSFLFIFHPLDQIHLIELLLRSSG